MYNSPVSGHSKWSTIKRQKEANDQVKGKVFSKLVSSIAVAVKTGGGADPEANYKLRIAIDTAKAANMPKQNIERAIQKASSEGGALEEVQYEGFGPAGVGILVEAATDNRNRTGAEIKNIFEKRGGSFGSPGSVAFNFEKQGLLLLQKGEQVEEQMLTLMDFDLLDLKETDDGIEAYVAANKLYDAKVKLENAGFIIKTTELVQIPKTMVEIQDPATEQKVINLLEALEDHDDVQKVFVNASF